MDIAKKLQETENIYKPKLRVQYLNEDGTIQSDRLVDQAIEFTNGPKQGHTGPLRIEASLMCQQDVESLKGYLDRVSSGLTSKQVNPRGRTPNAITEFNSPREEILNHIENIVKNDGRDQDEIITQLRGLGFVFMLTEDFLTYFPDFPFRDRDIGEASTTGQYPASLQWMVRCIKRAKDPKTDKYDPQIIFGFQIVGEREEKFVPYLYKERKKPIKAKIPTKYALSFNNTELTKFPKYMIEEERLKFSTEMRQLIASPERKPTKFFIRWYQDVIFSSTLKDQMAEAYERR